MCGINNITDIIITIIFIEVILIMILLFKLQSKTKQHERDINTLSVKSRECEKQMEAFQKKNKLAGAKYLYAGSEKCEKLKI